MIIYTPQYHPASNGQADQTVKTLKAEDWHTRLPRMLFSFRTTPITITQKTTAELLMGRNLETIFDGLHPHSSSSAAEVVAQEVRSGNMTEFKENDTVIIHNYVAGSKWIPGVVCTREGPVTYQVQTQHGRMTQQHDQMLQCPLQERPLDHTQHVGQQCQEDSASSFNRTDKVPGCLCQPLQRETQSPVPWVPDQSWEPQEGLGSPAAASGMWTNREDRDQPHSPHSPGDLDVPFLGFPLEDRNEQVGRVLPGRQTAKELRKCFEFSLQSVSTRPHEQDQGLGTPLSSKKQSVGNERVEHPVHLVPALVKQGDASTDELLEISLSLHKATSSANSLPSLALFSISSCLDLFSPLQIRLFKALRTSSTSSISPSCSLWFCCNRLGRISLVVETSIGLLRLWRGKVYWENTRVTRAAETRVRSRKERINGICPFFRVVRPMASRVTTQCLTLKPALRSTRWYEILSGSI
ncbi:hypothetical protein PR048_002543 [Dryococelus australis]|uniref:Integrase catalytic domain-containing protein n=1 Tax=Dryococelus australis TaxID=614101 RepID=A0ABQ9IKJ2_9NEOP|nr:hypothetical protein PR048_002543 [Dryococelus australis]